MAPSERELANVETAKAYQVGDLLLVRIAGEKPNGCHFLDLERSLLDVETSRVHRNVVHAPERTMRPGAHAV